MLNNKIFPEFEEDFTNFDINDDFVREDVESEEEQGMFEHYRFNVDKGQTPIRLDKYIAAHTEGISRNRIQLAIDADYVCVNGNFSKANYKVKPFDIITISLPYQRKEFEIIPEKMDLEIKYEDDDVLVVNKPAGLVVHPGHGHFSGTLLNGLAYYFGKNCEQSAEDKRLGILVHRIDKDTSGTLLIAKNDEAQLFLANQFFVHSIERKYIAIVWGDMEKDSGTITGNIVRDPNNRLKFKVTDDETKGKYAVTHYKVLERLGYITVIECTLETGRTHQIRVHLNHIGHPLFNDELYGGDRILKGTLYSKYKQFINNCFKILPRQGLHAKTIGFIHPSTHEKITVESELPEDMTLLIAKFRDFVKNRKN